MSGFTGVNGSEEMGEDRAECQGACVVCLLALKRELMLTETYSGMRECLSAPLRST